MTDTLFNPELIGSNPKWWTGIIVSDQVWKENQKSEKWNDIDSLSGWGARYKVRIVGKHSNSKNKLKDNQLELCEVLYPVTAGSGHAASYQSPNLRQGSVVFGIYKDDEGNEPLIIGCLGNNEQTALNTTQENGFDTLSAFTTNVEIPNYAVVPGESSPITGPGGSVSFETNTASSGTRQSLADQEAAEDQRKTEDIASTSECEPIPLGKIQTEIKNLIKDVEKAKKSIKSWKTAASNKIKDIENWIRKRIERASEFIAGGVKWIIGEIKKYITKKVENGAKDFYYFLFPSERPKAKKAVETALDLIACLFRKIIGNLISIIARALLAIVDRFINTPLCAVETIIGALIGKLTGLINSALSAILAPINAILGIVDLAGDIIGFVVDLLTFLSCDEKPQCSTVKEWSIYDGPGTTSVIDLSGLINKVKTFASSVVQSVDPNNFNFNLDFSDIFDNICNVGAVFCGPPTVQFFGGGGSGTAGNAIISAAGEILGIDITTPGFGYSSPPVVKFVDNCGNGTSAVGTAVLGEVPTNTGTTTGVVAVIMEDSGTNYLASPNGDRGGDGRVWAKSNETTVQRADGTYDIPYTPGDTINLLEGDTVTLPYGTTVNLDNGDIIIGGTDYNVQFPITITAPVQDSSILIRGDYPTLDNGQYPVILYLCGIEISNSGFNYSENDKIIIEPAKGAVAVPTFGPFGVLIGVKVTSQGEGFSEVPNIYIQSETGYNAKLLPRFCIDRISQDKIKEPNVQDKIISVIDCVGKVPQTDFFRVPQ